MPGVEVSFAQKLCVVQGLIHEFESDVLFGAQVLLDFFLSVVVHIVFLAKVVAEFFILFIDVQGEVVDLDVLLLLHDLDFLE